MLQLYGVQPKGFAADSGSLTLVLPYSAIGQVDHIALELEDSGAFADVRPVTDQHGQTIQLQMRLTKSAVAPATPPG